MKYTKKYLPVLLVLICTLSHIPTSEIFAASTTTYQWQVTTTKTVKTKTIKKTTKMAKKAQKTKTTTSKPNTKVSNQQTVNTAAKKVSVNSVVTIRVLTCLKKGSRLKQTVTTIKTVKSTTTRMRVAKKADTYSAVKKTENIRDAAPLADNNVAEAFCRLGFQVMIDTTSSYAGRFDARGRQIILREEGSKHIYHELGHFLVFVSGAASSGFEDIYQLEKKKYTLSNKVYVTQDKDEFFAEAYSLFVINPVQLKKMCPQTYKAVKDAVALVTGERIAQIYSIYRSTWESSY